MYPGYLLLGDSPFVPPGETTHEIVNNARSLAYAMNAGLCWIHDCVDCPSASVVIPGGPNYISPKDDGAPWFDADNPDTFGFLGLYGLEVTGAEDSTRTTNVVSALSGGGVIGRSYFGPRTIVVRALALAIDECALQAGLEWFQFQCDRTMNPCAGDNFTFFDCCPCMCDDPTPGGPCWAVTYRELRLGPICTHPEGTPAFLDGGLGTVTTLPTPGVGEFMSIVFRVNNVTASGYFAGQWDPAVGGWTIGRTVDSEGTSQIVFGRSAVGQAHPNSANFEGPPSDDTWEWLALQINRDNGVGQAVFQLWTSDDGVTWVPLREPLTVSGTVNLPTTLPALTIGAGLPDLLGSVFQGDVAVVALYDGPFPQTGMARWVFSAATYPFAQPGTPPTIWTDPNGREWTVDNAAALTAAGPGQAGAWWPTTYAELRDGPPLPDDDWCAWVDIYIELRNGVPGWTCCADMCVVPYFRQFRNARITEGPTVLRHPQMHSAGAMMEVEFTLVAADPTAYGLPGPVLNAATDDVDAMPYEDPPVLVAAADPFAGY